MKKYIILCLLILLSKNVFADYIYNKKNIKEINLEKWQIIKNGCSEKIKNNLTLGFYNDIMGDGKSPEFIKHKVNYCINIANCVADRTWNFDLKYDIQKEYDYCQDFIYKETDKVSKKEYDFANSIKF